MAAGRFFQSDTAQAVVVSATTLMRMKIEIRDPETDTGSAEPDSIRETVIIEADSLIGQPVKIISAVFDGSGLGSNPVLKRGHSVGVDGVHVLDGSQDHGGVE